MSSSNPSDWIEQAKQTLADSYESINIKPYLKSSLQFFRQADSDDGTGLRQYITQTRLQLNQRLTSVQQKCHETKQSVDETLSPVYQGAAIANENLHKIMLFRDKHPNAFLTGGLVVVAVPSYLLRGKWVMARNVILGSGLYGGLLFGVDYFDRE